jgi:hypothetical protein
MATLAKGYKLVHKYLLTTAGGIDAGVFTTGGTGTGASTGDPPGGYMELGPTTGKKWYVNRMIVNIGSAGAPSSTLYGDIAAFTNGLTVAIQGSTGAIYYLGGTTQSSIKSNFDWTRVCYDFNTFAYAAREPLVGRWTFGKSGQPVILDGDASEKIRVTFQDGTTGLALGHTFQIQGYEKDK